ncbi:DUF1963 domain-containing protein [Kitasatospora aureofaciens]|uniref:DUF1963 domain-containing protein n=1 Tax=Kitasatospora aureofaciens TaxID=1894 RepID=UPI000524CB85|nr:DUF1963 domain-containing protein [Kitasatospora aureofaciens]
MTRTTPPRPVDVEQLFPELAPLRREAIRLHPRAGSPSPAQSSVGGPLLWPADEPWPLCPSTSHPAGWDRPETEGPVPMVSVVQIHRRDVPQLDFPAGTDLLQVLWCPFIVGLCPEPTPRVLWRSSDSVGPVLVTAPSTVSTAPEDSIPAPCVLHPEPVVDYPSWDMPEELGEELRFRMEELKARTGLWYSYHLAEAPGIKLGGYPSWTQEPCWPDCPACGQAMDHLLTVSSWEYDGLSYRTWLPLEDRDSETGEERRDTTGGRGAHSPAQVMFGDAGGVYIFECRSCPDRPVDHHWDCS